MLVFIGFTLFLLLRWTQVILAKGVARNFYYRWWMALVAALVGAGIITLSGPRASLPIILNQLHDGALEGADYWRDEPMILSAGMGFDNIIGLPELTEETVREAGGSWYGSVTCTSGKAPVLDTAPARPSRISSNGTTKATPITMMVCQLSSVGRLPPKRLT
ncbi:MAG: hypothetical protein IPM84_11220 [Anaerolineae bacterium]|nr:hypothetical protein [Anaerolineae bacterium]